MRLAPGVYLGVVPVTLAADGVRVGGQGEVLDWVLEMRRLPKERMLDRCIARGSATTADVDAAAVTLIHFYERAERAPIEGREYRDRLEADVEAKRLALEAPAYGLDFSLVRAAVARQRSRIRDNMALLELRGATVIDAHGDLRPEHICLEPQPVIIDCLEFDRELRLLDPVSELSFLALECRRLGADWIGERILSRYAGMTGDAVPERLLDCYQGLHALIRAAVAIWHLDDVPNQAERWRARASDYLRMAAAGPQPFVTVSRSHSDPSVCSR
jgi:aminoglycoside phosphotransferase family enzyme